MNPGATASQPAGRPGTDGVSGSATSLSDTTVPDRPGVTPTKNKKNNAEENDREFISRGNTKQQGGGPMPDGTVTTKIMNIGHNQNRYQSQIHAPVRSLVRSSRTSLSSLSR